MSANHSSPVPRKRAQTKVSAAAARRRVLRRLPTRLPVIMARGETLLDTSTPQNLGNKPLRLPQILFKYSLTSPP